MFIDTPIPKPILVCRFQGILIVQTSTYFSTFKKDTMYTRSFVAFIALLNM
jgi:hypothetical protein